jgi:hypothetical protein
MSDVASRRLAGQRLADPARGTPVELVAWMGAVQAQDYAATKWAVGLRLRGGREVEIDRAIGTEIIRLHAMRFTWQLVAPKDVHWVLRLVSDRLLARAAGRFRRLGLDARTIRRAETVFERALAGGVRTRHELATALERAKISTDGDRLSHLLGIAELHELLCNGPRRDKEFTYTLLDRLAPDGGRAPIRAESLAELARRYFTSRGPATLPDFVWWSGLTTAEARQAIADAGLAAETIGATTHWSAGNSRATAPALLLPAFDEYLVAYKDRRAVLDAAHVKLVNAGGGLLGPCIVVGGRVVGTWRRQLQSNGVSVELAPFVALGTAEKRAVEDAARRYAAFLGVELTAVGIRPSRATRPRPRAGATPSTTGRPGRG